MHKSLYTYPIGTIPQKLTRLLHSHYQKIIPATLLPRPSYGHTHFYHHCATEPSISSRHDDYNDKRSSSSSSNADTPKVQINKYTGRPFSAKFWSILEKRRSLPVWDYYNKFMETIKTNSAMVLVGETGSGKTTQVRVEPVKGTTVE